MEVFLLFLSICVVLILPSCIVLHYKYVELQRQIDANYSFQSIQIQELRKTASALLKHLDLEVKEVPEQPAHLEIQKRKRGA